MPALNWDAFGALPGSPQVNFELLCRGVIRQNYGSYGVFRALANQPGVEFHLQIERPCQALGKPGRWWGWQCRWYDLSPGTALGTARRRKVQEAIETAEAHVPDLTDWVLWTRRPLSKTDQDWFNGINSKMTLHLSTGDDIDNLLGGSATNLRGTYFGELVLTPDALKERHNQSVASICTRWQPEVHQVIDAERELRRMLGESNSWEMLRAGAKDLHIQTRALTAAPKVPMALAPLVTAVADSARQFALALETIATAIQHGDIDLLRGELGLQPRALDAAVATTPRRLRAANQRANLPVTNAVSGCNEALRLLDAVESAFSESVVAVIAPAGCGKTQLAAQLTANTGERLHGVLLHGRDLHANQTLDHLAQHVSIAARPVASMESLLAAVDAAGQRARQRLPH